MAFFRLVIYKIVATTEEQIDSTIDNALDTIPANLAMSRRYKWREYPLDGYYRGFVRDDSSGIRLLLLYNINQHFDGSFTVCLIWERIL